MFARRCCVLATAGLMMMVLLSASPARADGIGVMRFLVNNQYVPKQKTRPSWLARRVVRPMQEYRHARRDVKRLRANPRLDRTFEAAFSKAAHERFNPRTSTIFGYFAAVAKGNKAGRLAVIAKAKMIPGTNLSPRSLDYLARHQKK